MAIPLKIATQRTKKESTWHEAKRTSVQGTDKNVSSRNVLTRRLLTSLSALSRFCHREKG